MMLMQEIGRGGRDGEPAKAEIYPFRSKGVDYGQPPFKIPFECCVRDYLLNFFISARRDKLAKELCCTFCKLGTGSFVGAIARKWKKAFAGNTRNGNDAKKTE
jgi:hypothetical protein